MIIENYTNQYISIFRNNVFYYNKIYINNKKYLNKIFNKNEFNKLLNNCDTMVLGEIFDSEISTLQNIKNIIFEDSITVYPKNIYYPYGIKKIRFGNNFDQPIDELPSSLEEIEFSNESKFNQSVDNLPNLIKKISFGKYFNIPLNNLSPNLEYLDIQSNFFSLELKNIPKGLKYLYFNTNPYYFYEKEILNLPQGLIEITYPYSYQFEILNLPKSVKLIRVSNEYEFINQLKLRYSEKKIIIY